MTRDGTPIRDLRRAKGLTLRALASKIGVSHVFVSEIERGACSIPLARVDAFARALGCDVSALSPLFPVAVRIAALRAIVALDSIKCAAMAPCEGPVTTAIEALIAIARLPDAPDEFNAAKELAAAESESV